MSQEGHVRKKGVVSVCRTIFNTSNKGIAKHHIDKRKRIQLIKPEFLINSYVSIYSSRLILADLFLYSYESEFLQKLVKDKKIHEARAFNFTYRYIDDVLSINNSRFAEFLPLIYPPELEVKETTDTASSASFLDLYLEFDDSGQLSTKIYDKRDDFNFKIINFPNMCSNIPASPAYGVYISQLIRYARASSNYSDFLKRHLHLRNRLLDQGYKKIRLIRSLKKFIFRYQYLVEIYSVSAEKIISDAFSYSENV